MFWINIKLNWHYHYFNFGLSSHPILNIKKPNMLSHHSYFTTKKGDENYEQQCDIIFKSKHLWFQTLLIITIDDKTILCQICEYLKKYPLLASKVNWKSKSSSKFFKWS